MVGRELSEHDERGKRAGLVVREEITPVLGVAPGVDLRQVHLRAGAVGEPVLDAGVGLGAKVGGYRGRGFGDFDAFAVGVADFARDVVVLLG